MKLEDIKHLTKENFLCLDRGDVLEKFISTSNRESFKWSSTMSRNVIQSNDRSQRILTISSNTQRSNFTLAYGEDVNDMETDGIIYKSSESFEMVIISVYCLIDHEKLEPLNSIPKIEKKKKIKYKKTKKRCKINWHLILGSILLGMAITIFLATILNLWKI